MLEVPAHLDIQHFNVAADYSLHTEYSSKARKLDSPLLDGLNAIKGSHRKGVPVLWVSKEWAGEFADFTIRLVAANHPPKVIEIHPSFMDGTMSVEAFLDIYAVYESKILEHCPDCEILIENRSGTKHPKPFMVSDADSILRLGMALEARSLRLGIALDMAQMFTREFGSKKLVGSAGVELVRRLIPIRDRIHSLHLWALRSDHRCKTGMPWGATRYVRWRSPEVSRAGSQQQDRRAHLDSGGSVSGWFCHRAGRIRNHSGRVARVLTRAALPLRYLIIALSK
jgi:hypothetical protein